MLTTETYKYVFTAPYTNERYCYIPLDEVDSIDSVEVSEKGRMISATTEVKNNQLWIRWSHELSPPESHTFVLKYRVKGGLRIHDTGDQVYWKAIVKDREAPVHNSKVTVRLPAWLAGQTFGIKSYGVPADARKVDPQTVEFVSREPLSPGKELEVKVTFPHGIVDAPIPAWQQKPVKSENSQKGGFLCS